MWLIDLIREIRRCKTCEAWKSMLENSKQLHDSITKSYQERIYELETYLHSLAIKIDELESKQIITKSDLPKPVGGYLSWRQIRNEVESKYRKPIEPELEKEEYKPGEKESA